MSFDASAWQHANIDQDGSNPPPEPGSYEVELVDARAFTSNAGDDYLLLEWRIITGSEKGYSWPDIHGFKNDGAVKAAKSKANSIGVNVVDIGSLDELDSAVKEKVGEYYVVEVKQNGEYKNTYVDAPLSDVPAQGIPGVPAGVAVGKDDDEPVPF